MFQFQDANSLKLEVIRTRIVIIYEDDKLLINSTFNTLRNIVFSSEKKRGVPFAEIGEVLDEVESKFPVSNFWRLKEISEGYFNYSYDRFLADILDSGDIFIFDKLKQQYVTTFNVREYKEQMGPGGGSRTRKFYIGKRLVHEIMDYIC